VKLSKYIIFPSVHIKLKTGLEPLHGHVKEARQRLEQIVSDICRDENTWHVARRLP